VIDFEPSEEQQLIIDTVHGFAENEIRGAAEAHGGGGERSAVTGALVAEELAWGDLSIALAILSPSLLALPVAEFGTEEQQRELLPRFTRETFAPGSLALVEPRHQSDPFRPRVTARREGDAYVLSGRKCLVPWLDGGEAVLVIADEEGAPQAYIVPRNSEGGDVRVPASARLGGEAGADVRRIVAQGRVGLAAMAVGVSRAAFEIARDYAKEREAFGGPIAAKQAIAFKLADMAIEIDGTRLLVWEAAWKLDRGEDATREATLAYDQARRVSLEVTDGAVQVLGGHGYIRDYLPEMHLRNARGFAVFEALTLV
jgi:alkylation response protein AidB-like acyl-CoA dehydrogenase